MSVIDEVLGVNKTFAARFELGSLPMPPARKLAILACMDARLTIEPMLGLKTGEAHIIRNAGGIATEDAVRSLIISHHLLGTREFMIINHTDCGMLTFHDDELRQRLRRQTGADATVPSAFHSFSNPEENVRDQIRKIRAHPWLPQSIPIRGFVYDVATGALKEVATAHRSAA